MRRLTAYDHLAKQMPAILALPRTHVVALERAGALRIDIPFGARFEDGGGQPNHHLSVDAGGNAYGMLIEAASDTEIRVYYAGPARTRAQMLPLYWLLAPVMERTDSGGRNWEVLAGHRPSRRIVRFLWPTDESAAIGTTLSTRGWQDWTVIDARRARSGRS